MKKRARESKLNVALTVVLVTFVCALAFSVGVVSGKGWSDREYALKTIDGTSRMAASESMDDQENTALSEDLTDKEVELLTAKALEEARKNPVEPVNEADALIAEMQELDRLEKLAKGETPKDSPDESATKVTPRKVASVPKKPTMPKPSEIEYTVQVASYKSKEEAEEHSQKLIEKGFPAFPVSAKVKGQTWYRVSVGSFVSRNAAVKYERDLKKQAAIKNSIVQKVRR